MATAATVFRDYETDGVPASGSHKVKKSDVRQLLGEYESTINAFLSNGGLIYTSKAAMDADLAHGANSSAWVIGDATVANNGIYRKIGASGVGSWTRVADLPFSFIIASDTGAGTANAIQATTSIPVSSSALVWMNIFEANTASPVTVSFNGGSVLAIKTNSGNDVAPGGLVAGMIVMGIVSGSTFRLVSDQASSAVLAACEAARDAAISAVPNQFPATRAALKAINTVTHTAAYLREAGREGQFIWKTGDYSARIAADPLEGIYIKADAIAATAGAWVRQGGWALQGGYAEWFGAVADYNEADGSGTDNDAAINAALSLLPRVYLAGGYYRIANTVNGPRYNALVYANGAQSMPVGDDTYFTTNSRACLVPRNLPRTHTINSMITQCELSGGLLANPSAAESYTASSAGRLANYRIMDFTNQNASGATRATQRAVSIAVKGARGFMMDGVSIRTTRANGNFVSQAADTDFGNQCDIGFLGENAFFGTLKNAIITWGFRDSAVLLITDDVTGDSPDYHPQTDRFFIDNCFIEGHCSLAVRGPDAVRISAVSATEIRVKWFKSHRFASTGSVEADGANYTYSSLTYDAGTQELVFGGLSANPVTGGVAVGETLYRTEDVRTFGTGGVSVNNSFIRSISHPSLKPTTDGFYTDFFPMSGRNIELSGLGVRGIHFNNCYIHGREDISFFANDATDIFFSNSYHEAKFLAAGSGSNASRFVALNSEAKTARGIPQPAGQAGQIYFNCWSQTEGGTDMRPTWRTSPSGYGRFGNGTGMADGLFEPGAADNEAYDYSQQSSTPYRVIRFPKVRDNIHPLHFLSDTNTLRGSFDNSGRFALGFGYDTTTALTHYLSVFGGSNSVIAAINQSGTQTAGFRGENTAGSADFRVDGTGAAIIRSGNVTRASFAANKWNPGADNAYDLGTAATGRFRDLFLVNAPTVTSDADAKLWIGDLSDAELRVAKRLSALVGVFKWKDAIAAKGEDAARIHAGVTVQSVIAAFDAEGLDAMRYGVVCYDEWEAADEIVSEIVDEETGDVVDREVTPAVEAGHRYSLRPDELWAFVAAGFEARLAALEAVIG
ncbi:tail fiber domain-containing protein [Sinorhizobium meliloti]|uniref:tail fiber domain-containing protein n=1 Tax=Rhizobium meliloti TaxID=382 RepID=UPI00041DB430|nr:tail fiber domain-containing protein [Sinorhizobium meliloti]